MKLFDASLKQMDRLVRTLIGIGPDEDIRSAGWMPGLIILAFMGLFCIFLQAIRFEGGPGFLAVAMTGFMLAGASLLVGILVGFLFGIPKSQQPNSGEGTGAENGAGAVSSISGEGDVSELRYRPNTNLEQISDWLSKILVGAGLTQIHSIGSGLKDLSQSVGKGLGDAEFGPPFALAIIVAYLICGFLGGFLWARLFLPRAMAQADLAAAVKKQVGEVEAKFEERGKQQEKQQEKDLRAYSMVQRCLNEDSSNARIDANMIVEAMKGASEQKIIESFYTAERIRRVTWRDQKELMERTIPVFQALVTLDPEGRFHKNHGQLGFALKDQRAPDWKGALEHLSRAIEIRDGLKEQGWVFYEYNRILCRLNLDGEFQSGRKSDAATTGLILKDLRAVAGSDISHLLDEPPVLPWIQLNKIRKKDLAPAGG